jgi:hypothetical protein
MGLSAIRIALLLLSLWLPIHTFAAQSMPLCPQAGSIECLDGCIAPCSPPNPASGGCGWCGAPALLMQRIELFPSEHAAPLTCVFLFMSAHDPAPLVPPPDLL